MPADGISLCVCETLVCLQQVCLCGVVRAGSVVSVVSSLHLPVHSSGYHHQPPPLIDGTQTGRHRPAEPLSDHQWSVLSHRLQLWPSQWPVETFRPARHAARTASQQGEPAGANQSAVQCHRSMVQQSQLTHARGSSVGPGYGCWGPKNNMERGADRGFNTNLGHTRIGPLKSGLWK